MKYLLTLEKFKSNILTKVFKIVNSDVRFKNFLYDLLEEHGIQLSELTDEYFQYIPVSKVVSDKREVEIKEDEYKIVDKNGKYIDGSIEEGDFLLFKGGYFHKVDSPTDIDITQKWLRREIERGNIIKIPKKYSNDLIVSIPTSIHRPDSYKYSFKLSGDQVWKYEFKGELKKDTLFNITNQYHKKYIKISGFMSRSENHFYIGSYGLKQLIKYYKYDFRYDDSDIIFGFDLTNTIQYYSKGSDVKLQELKESSDYVIIFDIEKAKENLSNVKDKRKEREKGKEGSHHFMSKDDILKMNRERLVSKLNDRYELSEKDIENLKNIRLVRILKH